MNTNVVSVVFFGDANYGKSTIVGRIYAENHNVDMAKTERELREQLGSLYAADWLYPSLVNPQIVESVKRGKKGASETHEIRNIEIEFEGMPTNTSFIDTPGQQEYQQEAAIGMEKGIIGFYCISVEKLLSDEFSADLFSRSEAFAEFHPNSKLIYLLTKFDLPVAGYKEESYEYACEIIREYAAKVEVTKEISAFGMGMGIMHTEKESDVNMIIPVAVEFDTAEKEGVNLFARSKKTPWYDGFSLVEAVRSQVQAINNANGW